jgi:hypothetical protein
MSLEQRLDALTAALEANTALLAIITERGKANVGAASATKANTDENEDKPATTRSTKPSDKDSKPATTRKPAKEKIPSAADMKAQAEAYLNVEDEDEYQGRRTNVRAITDYCGGETFSKLEGDARLTASKLLAYAAKADDFDPEDVQSTVDHLVSIGELADPEAATEKSAKNTRSRRTDDV